MDWLVTEAVWFGAVALIIAIDAGRRKRVAENSDDLSDKSVWPWIIVAVLLGPLVLPVYFWNTRRRASSTFAGVALTVLCLVGTIAARQAFAALSPKRDWRESERRADEKYRGWIKEACEAGDKHACERLKSGE